MKICAIIPARGGSKGIPLKNLKPIGGIPLITRTINAALNTSHNLRVIVSTDHDEIAKISKLKKVDVIKRNAKLSGDEVSSELVLIDVLKKLKAKENYFPDITLLLQCTSPFTISEDIDKTINAMINKEADCSFTATYFHHFLWKKNNLKSNVYGINHDEKKDRLRRQEINNQYIEAGSVYAMKTKEFVKKENRFFGKIAIHIIPSIRVFEIDNPIDLNIANCIEASL